MFNKNDIIEIEIIAKIINRIIKMLISLLLVIKLSRSFKEFLKVILKKEKRAITTKLIAESVFAFLYPYLK